MRAYVLRARQPQGSTGPFLFRAGSHARGDRLPQLAEVRINRGPILRFDHPRKGLDLYVLRVS